MQRPVKKRASSAELQTEDQGRKPRANAKEAILRTFARLVAEKGYGEASIANIADELGLSKGTVAFHFGSKEALLRELIELYMQRRLDEAATVCAQLASATEQLCGMIYALLALHRDDRESSHSFLREFLRFKDHSGNERLRDQRTQYFEIVHQIVRRGMKAGEFRTDDSRIITFQIFGMCNYAWTWLRADGPRTIEEIAATFCNTIIFGLRTPGADPLSAAAMKKIMSAAIKAVNATPDRML